MFLLCLLSVCLSAEHLGDRHPTSAEADAPLQLHERGRDDGVLGPGERLRGQARGQTQTTTGQEPGLFTERVL